MKRQTKIRIWLCLVSCLVGISLATVSSYGQEGGGQLTTKGAIEFLPEETAKDSSSTDTPKIEPTDPSDTVQRESNGTQADDVFEKKPSGRLPSTGERVLQYGGVLVAIGALGYLIWALSRKRGERQ